MPSASFSRTRFSPTTFSSARPTASLASAAGTTTTPSWSPSTRSPGATSTPPQVIGTPTASTSIRPRESAQWIPAAKVGKPSSISARVSRVYASATRPRAPLERDHGGELAAVPVVAALRDRVDFDTADRRRVAGHLHGGRERPDPGIEHL